MIVWLALIPAVFLAMLAMERLEERLVPHPASPDPEPLGAGRIGAPAGASAPSGPGH